MDPNANLREQRELVGRINRINDACPEDGDFTEAQREKLVQHALRLGELVQALDEWISRGGFLPEPWLMGQAIGARVVCKNKLSQEG